MGLVLWVVVEMGGAGSREQSHRNDVSCPDIESSWVMEVPKILQSSYLQDS